MPRPIKCRKVCHFPDILEFRPSNEKGGRGEGGEKEAVLLTVDEYETIRLIDKEGYSQEQCAGFMQIARTTVQRIYEIARKKVADAIIDGHPLRIEGGDFRICDGKSSKCGLGGCYKQDFIKKKPKEKEMVSDGNAGTCVFPYVWHYGMCSRNRRCGRSY